MNFVQKVQDQADERCKILQKRGVPLLGVIILEIEQLCASSKAYLPIADAASAHQWQQHVWTVFDKAFAGRADYYAWRRLVTPWHFFNSVPHLQVTWTKYISPKSGRDPIKAILAQLNSEINDPAIPWGCLALVGDILRRSDADSLSYAEMRSLVDAVDSFLSRASYRHEFAAVSAAAALFTLATSVRVRKDFYGRNSTSKEVAHFVRNFTRLIGVFDPDWRPGERVNTQRLENDDQRLRPVAGYAGAGALASSLGLIAHLWELAFESERLIDPELATTVFGFTKSAWYTIRKRRLSLQDSILAKRAGSFSTRQQKRIDELVSTEESYLRQCIKIARDSGNDLECAKLSHIYLRLFRSEPSSEQRRWLDGTKTVQRVSQVGLEIPSWAEKLKRPPPPASQQIQRGQYFHTLSDKTHLQRQQLRVKDYMNRNQGLLRTLETWFGSEVNDDEIIYPWGIARDFAKVFPASEETAGAAKAAFDVALDFGFFGFACEIFDRHELTDLRILTDLVHSIKRAMQIALFGLKEEKIEAWRSFVIAGALRIGFDEIPGDLLLSIHDLCAGRNILNQAKLSGKLALGLYKKGNNIWSESELGEIYDKELSFDVRGYAFVVRSRIAEALRSIQDNRSLEAVAASVLLDSKSGAVSILVMNARGTIEHRHFTNGSLLTELEATKASENEWFLGEDLFGEHVDYESPAQIMWPPGISRVFHEIADVARSICPQHEAIFLTAHHNSRKYPPFVGLPLTHGYNLAAALPHKVAINVVPSLSWLCVRILDDRNNGGMRQGTLFQHGDINDPVIAEAAPLIGANWSYQPYWRSVQVVLAHGPTALNFGIEKENSKLPHAYMQDGTWSSYTDWEAVLNSRNLVLHVCYGGELDRGFLGELGAIPGLALGLGVTMVIAPVRKVKSETAKLLDARLSVVSNRSVIQKYLEAYRQDKRVSLYNIYGNGTEII